MKQPKFDRSAVMRRANKLVGEGVSRKIAMARAWKEQEAARSQNNAPLAALASRQQPGAAAAALRRYGVEPDVFAIAAKRLAEMASAAVKAAAAATRRGGPVAALPYDPRRAIEARRGSDGVYR
ncbi:hypothetical protein OGR47_20795 (plasmid) [Methylocystis sp. MJC1]|uniref:hypothetical protein n=1 Tax=Methylocystis sp. MJC1 TaxID=2654282 RepID=UPI0013EC9955|nr:hypothetical protein [Methylocystis sp. MJC1]KAF2989306.1 hypothetical protein MJC1_03624 [Methylocystis sp. MJC1]MBU6529336.1 hypothetical protein [Methylocystis sp. MJC1]UZX14195.1 hypothetical protein OGR47_20795 [Methylocystis sp. MJC1]